MAGAEVLVGGKRRKGKLIVNHPSAFRHYLFSNGLEGTRIRFDAKIPFPFTKKGEKSEFERKFDEAFRKKAGSRELAR